MYRSLVEALSEAESLSALGTALWMPGDARVAAHIRGSVSLPPPVTVGLFARLMREVDARIAIGAGAVSETHLELVVRRG
ncbi:MAG: hypothetical protein AB1730_15980 [Myxococcota bacterium]|jgi:hypothetical protein